MKKVKPGVSIKKIQPQMLLAWDLLDQLFSQYGTVAMVTSGDDGTHMKGSLHYKGLALDFRTKELFPDDKTKFLAEAKTLLNPLGFDVILEELGTGNEHMHVEFDPKG